MPDLGRTRAGVRDEGDAVVSSVGHCACNHRFNPDFGRWFL